MRTIAVLNPKGGSAKTTTTVNIAASLAAMGRRVLVIDLDPQGMASSWLGVLHATRTVVGAIRGDSELTDLIHETTVAGVQLVPASAMLVVDNRWPGSDLARGLMRAMDRLPPAWDFALLDTAPTLGYLALAPLAISDGVLVPVEARGLALAALANVMEITQHVRGRLNPELRIDGILACRVTNAAHCRDVLESIVDAYPDLMMRTQVRDSIRMAEAPAHCSPISMYAPGSSGDRDYAAATTELLERIESDAHRPEKL